MPRPVATAVQGALAAGWVVLAFFSGGYGEEARAWALAASGAVVVLCALAPWGEWPLRRSERRAVARRSVPAAVAVGALALLTAWTAISRSWAPLDDLGGGALARDLIYLGALGAALVAWRERAAARAVEPLLAAGALVVVGYALAGRLLPGIVPETASISANGRLDQPLTYWNAMGALAALGLVACARMAGDRWRDPWLRVAAASAATPLLVGLVLTVSRGAMAAAAGGLVVLVASAPTWSQLRAVLVCLEPAALACIAAVAAPGVRALEGGAGSREAQGAAVLVAVVAAMAGAAALARWTLRTEADGRVAMGRLPLPARTGWIAAAMCVALLAVPVLAGSRDAGRATTQGQGATTGRLTSASSNRYDYWRVGLRAFARHPIGGVGAGGFRVEWLRHRPYPESVRDAHSLEVQVLCDLGLVGGLLLAAFFGGVAACATRVRRMDPGLAAGPLALVVTWVLHTSIDWDWEMPALTLAALLPVGMLLARACAEPE